MKPINGTHKSTWQNIYASYSGTSISQRAKGQVKINVFAIRSFHYTKVLFQLLNNYWGQEYCSLWSKNFVIQRFIKSWILQIKPFSRTDAYNTNYRLTSSYSHSCKNKMHLLNGWQLGKGIIYIKNSLHVRNNNPVPHKIVKL